MKKLSLFLCICLVVGLLSGCVGTTVVYHETCTCPVETQPAEPAPSETEPVAADPAAVKTGLYIGTNISGSANATADAAGKADYDVTLVAVTVDDNGVITSCVIDSLGTSVAFDANGVITSDVNAGISTKNELGEAYGMKLYAGAKYEWNEQAAAFAAYVTGLTAAQVEGIAVNEGTKPTDADLAATVTIAVGGYKALVVKAAQ